MLTIIQIIIFQIVLNFLLKGLPGYDRSCSITNTISKLKNVNLIKEDLLAHLKDTPLETLLKDTGGILDSEFPLAQRSDLVRAAILWKYGGLYLDHDVIVYRPLYCLKNTIGLKDCNINNNIEF